MFAYSLYILFYLRLNTFKFLLALQLNQLTKYLRPKEKSSLVSEQVEKRIKMTWYLNQNLILIKK